MLKRFFRNSVLAALALLCAAAAPSGRSDPNEGKREPIVITSDSMKAARLGDIVEFMGNVTQVSAILPRHPRHTSGAFVFGIRSARDPSMIEEIQAAYHPNARWRCWRLPGCFDRSNLRFAARDVRASKWNRKQPRRPVRKE